MPKAFFPSVLSVRALRDDADHIRDAAEHAEALDRLAEDVPLDALIALPDGLVTEQAAASHGQQSRLRDLVKAQRIRENAQIQLRAGFDLLGDERAETTRLKLVASGLVTRNALTEALDIVGVKRQALVAWLDDQREGRRERWLS